MINRINLKRLEEIAYHPAKVKRSTLTGRLVVAVKHGSTYSAAKIIHDAIELVNTNEAHSKNWLIGVTVLTQFSEARNLPTLTKSQRILQRILGKSTQENLRNWEISKHGIFNLLQGREAAFLMEKTGLKNDRSFVLNAIKQHPEVFQHAQKKLQSDRDFLLEAIQINPEVLQFAPEEFRGDREFIKDAMKIRAETLKYSDFKTDRRFILNRIKENAKVMAFATHFNQSKTFVMKAGRINKLSVLHAPLSIRSDPDVLAILFAR